MISRRSTLKAIGAGTLATGFGAGLGSISFAQSQQNPLQIPPQSLGTLSENTRQFQLNLQRGTSNFLPNLVTETIGINGNYLGPTLRFNRNEEVSLLVNNQLGEPSTLHWHGSTCRVARMAVPTRPLKQARAGMPASPLSSSPVHSGTTHTCFTNLASRSIEAWPA